MCVTSYATHLALPLHCLHVEKSKADQGMCRTRNLDITGGKEW